MPAAATRCPASPVVTTTELAEVSGRSHWAVRRLLTARRLTVPVLAVGPLLAIRREDLAEAVEQIRRLTARRSQRS